LRRQDAVGGLGLVSDLLEYSACGSHVSPLGHKKSPQAHAVRAG
jgi:hypothetical protein